ncbi:hypothetical protein J2P12_00090 [Candidatus Bathyarchaeota archaeon]|nr:hypothetical protein [Candidatus Bathyarchaeota archaeon]
MEDNMVQKAEVEINEKEKTLTEQAVDTVMKRLEKPIEAPPIEETLDKVKLAMKQAKKARKPVKQTWYCTDCGRAHVQNDGMDMDLDHISVDCLDGEFVDAHTGQPLTGKPLTLMEKYAVPNVDKGRSHAQSANAKTLAKMRELKAKGE